MSEPTPTPQTDPLSVPQRLAGIELQLMRLNAQVRTATRWMQIRETIAILTRLVIFGLIIFGGIAFTQFLRELKDRPLFGDGPGAIDSLQESLKDLKLPDFGQ